MDVSPQESEVAKLCNKMSSMKNRSAEEALLDVNSLLMSDSDVDERTADEVEEGKENPPTAAETLAGSILDIEKGQLAATSSTNSDLGESASVVEVQSKAPRTVTPPSDLESVKEFKLKNSTNLNNRKKISQLVDSDSSTEEDDSHGLKDVELLSINLEERTVGVNMSQLIVSRTKEISALVDSESEAEIPTPKMRLSKPKKKSKRSDTDSDVEKCVESEESSHQSETKIVSIADSDMQSELSEDDNRKNVGHTSPHEELSASDSKKNARKSKPLRASAQRAMDEMLSIQSEQQRLHREAHISIPYHKPKRHTLREFLERHSTYKPQAYGNGGDAAPAVHTKHLKMSPEELMMYAKLMEKRAKEATEFFKSESEDEENDRDVSHIKDNESDWQRDDLEKGEQQVYTEAGYVKVASATDIEPQATIAPTYMEEMATAARAIITEVIELPRLDFSSVDISVFDDQPSTSSPPVTSRANVASVRIKELIMTHSLTASPTIKGDPNMLIDLETGDSVPKRSSGPDKLLQRLLQTNKLRKTKSSEILNILSTENGIVEMSKINVHITQDSKSQKEPKPGAAYFQLKENLKAIIAKKRLKELQKKQEELDEYNKCIFYDDEEDNCDEYEPEDKPQKKKTKLKQLDIVIDNEENPIEIDDIDDDEMEADTDAIAEKKYDEDDHMSLEGDEARDNDHTRSSKVGDNDDEDNNDDSNDASEVDELIDNGNDVNGQEKGWIRKNRIIQAFQDNSDDDLDFLKTPQPDQPSYISALYDAESPINFSDGEKELLGLCSGKFGVTQQRSAAQIINQMPQTQMGTAHDAAAELEGLCSGTFDDDVVTMTYPPATGMQLHVHAPAPIIGSKIFSSDDEQLSNSTGTAWDGEKRRVKKLTKKRVKRTGKLDLSEDEDEEDGNVPLEEELEPEMEAERKQPETYVDYDSEENEIIVKISKDDCLKQAQKFVEDEAELSESDWGSADEDERNMDTYDIELGDEDDFDGEKLRNELGQIHARKMLDEDVREVRKLQEMFFEDEEQDGVGRQRQFKWKNAESGFSLDDTNNQSKANGEVHNGESGDEENEHQWRKIRFEREQLLQEHQLKENSEVASSTTLNATTLTSDGTTPLRKLNIIMPIKQSVEANGSSPFLISNTFAAHKKTVRASFLVRDREMLTKLVGNTKRGNDADGIADTVSLKTIKPQNFVFATITEEEHESLQSLKRKSDDLMNTSSEHCAGMKKKPRRELRKDRCLIDQLL